MKIEIEIKQTVGKGRGVFASVVIPKGEKIESCPIILVPSAIASQLGNDFPYFYQWGEASCAIALGYGALYNHSENPNSYIKIDIENLCIDVFSIREIKPGEEITQNYFRFWNAPLWFNLENDPPHNFPPSLSRPGRLP